MKWENPKSPIEATKIIDEAEKIFSAAEIDDLSENSDNDLLEEVAETLAGFAACFNHNFTRAHRHRIMDILVKYDELTLNPVLWSLANCGRAEQVDFTNAFISNVIYKYKKENIK